jgi:hypothetical protein
MPRPHRVSFVAIHSDLDPSGGAALAPRELLDFTIPDRCTPSSPIIPSPHEVAAWVATIERLWDDPPFEARHRALAETEANRWDPALVAGQYQQLLSWLSAAPTQSTHGPIANVKPKRTMTV